MKESAWFSDGPAIVTLSGHQWKAAAYNPSIDTVLQETRIGGSSQYAELKAVVMTHQEDPSAHVSVYTDRWVDFKGLTTWIPTWKYNEWMIHRKVVWGGKEVWEHIWKEAYSCTINVGHVDAHMPLVPDFANYNRVADEIAKVNAVVLIDPVLMNLAN
ncbi:ribonuclease H-like [Lithobates pipiens]